MWGPHRGEAMRVQPFFRRKAMRPHKGPGMPAPARVHVSHQGTCSAARQIRRQPSWKGACQSEGSMT